MAEVKVDGKRFSSIHELFEFLEEERANRPWYKKAWHSAQGYYTRAFYRVHDIRGWFVNSYQRVRYGIGNADIIDFPFHNAKVTARACRWLAENAHVYPGEDRGFSETKWHAYLNSIAHDLENFDYVYNEAWNELDEDIHRRLEREAQALKRAQGAWHRYANMQLYIGD